jgi:tRNA pseudouridine55 synthase
VRCGKGVYIRSLARDLALAVGSVGHVVALRRTACGPFSEKTAISLANLEALGHKAARLGHLLPVATALDDIPALALTEGAARRLESGLAIQMSEAAPTGAASAAHATDDRPTHAAPLPEGDAVAQAYCGDRLVAIVRRDGDLLRSTRVFNLAR